MEKLTQKTPGFRFGAFELDVRTGELSRDGQKIQLHEQPLQLLLALLEHPGELVSREQLARRLWPTGTFVDFERSLNKAVNKLRDALGDSAEQPRFIETLPRRGYRFIVSVRKSSEDGERQGGAPVSSWRAFGPPVARAAKAAGILAALVLVVSLPWRLGRNRPTLAAIRSIAVLPLENLSGDPAQDYFADGMTDEMITDLGQIGSLRVISRTSAMQYKGARKSLPQIARELNVDAVVEGTVLLSGKRVRITAKLIHAPSDRHLWAQSYEGDLRDVLGLQNQVAAAIAAQVRATLTPQQQATLRSAPVVDPNAYQAYLRALSQNSTIDGLQKSVSYLNQAIEKQPHYAEAYGGMANAEIMLGHMLAVAPQEAFPAAERAALKAIALDDTLADAHAAIADVKFLYEWDFAGAEREFQRAIQLNPNSVWAHAGYADFLNAMGHPDEAIAERKRNEQIDPLSTFAVGAVAWELYWAGRYDEAIEQEQKLLVANPNSYYAHLGLGLCLEQKHDFARAIEELRKAVDLSNDKTWIGFVAHAMALSGDKVGAHKILADLEKESQRTYVSPWWPAIVYPDLGEKDQAFFWLEKAYQGREHDLVFSNVWPMFNSLRSDPRYQDLLRRVGLPQKGEQDSRLDQRSFLFRGRSPEMDAY
jgi:TolB-like protein/DNA-binding winged helix-turn-helix (wHTH) protein